MDNLQKGSELKFNGWWVLGGLWLVYFATNGIVFNTFPNFNPELMREFGWNESEATNPTAILYFSIAFITIGMGALLDRFSARAIMFVGAIGLLGAMVAYASIQTLTQLYGVYLLFSLFLAACGLVPSMFILTKWFSTKRGIAVGILLMASSFGGAVFPPLAGLGLGSIGWRNTALILTAAAAVLLLIPLWLWVRNNPAEMGQHPDGRAQDTPSGNSGKPVGVRLREALASPRFYLLAVATGSMWFCIVGIIAHQPIYFRNDIGLSAEQLGTVTGTLFFFGLIGKVLFGALSDRFRKDRIMLLAILNLTAGSLILRFTDGSISQIYIYAAVYGIGFSGVFTMIQLLIADYYQGQSYGKILGVMTCIDTLAGSSAIAILGKIKVASGSYISAFNVLVMVCIAATACVLILNWMGSPKRAVPAPA